MFKQYFISLCLVAACALAAENTPLFNAAAPLSGKLKVSNAELLKSAENSFSMQIPAVQGWPQANITLPPLPDARLLNLKFRAAFSTAPNNGWTAVLFLNNEKLAGGYLHQVQPDPNGFYRISLSGLPPGKTFNRIQIAFKNPSAPIEASFSDFTLETAAPEPFEGLENLAKGKKAVFTHAPNYPHCTNGNDPYDLTDGKYLLHDNQKIWMEPGTVGWRMQSTVIWSIDLEQSLPIAGVRYHTGAGMTGARWPLAIYVLVSEDNRTFALAGEMIRVNRHQLPEYNTVLKNLWLNMPVNAAARYVRFIVKCDGLFHFADEVEILRGKPEECRPYNEMLHFDGDTTDISSSFSAYERFENDLKFLTPSGELSALRRAVAADPGEYLAVKNTVAPLNRAQRELLKINLRQMQDAGLNGLSIWTGNRWDPLHIFSRPPRQESAPALELYMLQNERRGRVLNFANISDTPRSIPLPSHPAVRYQEAVCTDSNQNFLNANMLRPLTGGSLTVQPGATAQLWVEFDSAKLPPGKHELKLPFAGQEIPAIIHVADTALPEKLSAHFGTFDYINNLPSLYPGVDQNNFPAVREIIRKYQIDTIWGSMAVIPAVDERHFTDGDTLKTQPDYAAFDQWRGRFADAKQLMLFYYPGQTGKFAGVDHATEPERYRKRISEWLKAWNSHIQQNSPQANVCLHMIDEADAPPMKDLFDSWAKAAEAAAVNGKPFRLYFNPRLKMAENRDYAGADILVSAFSYEPETLAFYLNTANKRPAGRSFGFYQCKGNSRDFDPYTYYAMPVLSGIFVDQFYGFDLWDIVSAPRDLNEYNYQGMIFSPLYFDADAVYGSKQIEAIFNARQDYEYFRILREKLGNSHPLLKELRKDLMDEITAQGKAADLWNAERNRNRADQRQEKMWHAIKGLEK